MATRWDAVPLWWITKKLLRSGFGPLQRQAKRIMGGKKLQQQQYLTEEEGRMYIEQYRNKLSISSVLRRPTQPLRVEALTDSRSFEKRLIYNLVMAIRNHDFESVSAVELKRSLRCFAMSNGLLKYPLVVVNPEVLQVSAETQLSVEACAAFPGVLATIQRPLACHVRFLTDTGAEKEMVMEGKEAARFMHEYDHLEGILMTDRADPTRLDTTNVPNAEADMSLAREEMIVDVNVETKKYYGDPLVDRNIDHDWNYAKTKAEILNYKNFYKARMPKRHDYVE